MKKRNSNPEDSAGLRQRAEEHIRSRKSEISATISETDMLKLIHELEVNQIEVEMQNEELTLANEIARAATEKYEELYDFAPSGYFTLSRNGSILEINLRGAQMLGKQRSSLINSHFGFFIKEDSRLVFANFLDEIFRGKSHVNCDLPLIPIGDISLHVHLTGIMSDTKEQCRITAVDITERKIAEDDLRKNLAKYKVLIDTFPIGITISDPAGKIIETNEKALELLGLSRDEHLKRKLIGEEWTIIKPDGTVFPQDEYASEKALKEKRLVENVEMGIVKPGQGTTWLNVTAAPIPVEDFGVVIAYNDITPRKKVEQELTKAKQLFEKSEIQARDILQTAMDSFWMVNSEGCIINVNQVACEMLGYSREEMLTLRIADIDCEETLGHTQNRMQKIVETGEDRFETKHRCKDGRIIDVEVSVKSQPSDNFVVFISNITERKQAEKALKDRENLLNKVFDVLPIGLWFADRNGKLLRGNPAGVKIWGAEPMVPINEYGVFKARRHPSGIEIGPDDWALAHTIREGVTVGDEQLEIDAFDGQKKIILNYTAPVLDDNGIIQGAIVVNHDITERITAEQALLKSEEKYRQLIENSHDIIYTFSVDGVFMYVSPAWESLLGYPESEALGKSFHQLVHPDDLPACTEFFQKVITTNQRVEGIEYRIQHANGTWFWHTSSAVPLIDEEGQVYGYEGIARDITRRRQAEDELTKAKEKAEESEKKVREMTELLPQIVFETDIQGNLTYVNKYAYKLTGYSEQDSMIGKNTLDFYIPEDRERAVRNINLSLSDGTNSAGNEYTMIRKDGSLLNVVVYSNPIFKESKLAGLRGIIVDITELKQTEQELIAARQKAEENEEYFRNIFENSAVGKSITGLDGSLKTNKAFSRMLGYSFEEFQTENIFAITHPDDIQKTNDAIKILLNGEKQQVKFDKRYIHKNGSVVSAEVVTSLQRDRNGKPLFFITSVNDITERKHLEKIREIQYNIATAAVTSDNVEQLLEFTRVQLSQIFDTTNFFAALYDEKNNTFKKLHWVDEADDFVEWEAPQSFSGYVVRTGKTLLLNKQEIAKLGEEQNIPITGKPAECWLGVPLIADKKAIGVMVIQSYTDPNAFDTSSAMLFEQLAYYLSAFIEKNIILHDLNQAKLLAEENEQRLSAFINSIPDAISYKDGDGKWLLANEANLELFCLTGVDYFGKTDRELAEYTNLLYADAFRACMESDEISWNNKAMSKGIEVIPTVSGGNKVYEVYKIPSFHKNGERKGLAVIGRDITELYETQQNLLLAKQKAEESEDKFRTLSENSPAIIYRILLKPSMRFDYVSPIVTEITGYTPADHYADPDLGFKLVHPEDRHILEESIHKTQGEPIILRWIKKDGKIVWTEQRNVLIFDKDGNPFAIEGIATDITAQKEADAKVAFQANMLSQISEAVIATDMQGMITYWNNSAGKLYGWKQEEVLGKNINDVTPTSATKDQAVEIFNSLSKGQSFTGEFMVRCKDGHSFPAIVNDSPIYDSQSQLLGIVGISSDITERKLYESEIHTLNEELEQRVVNRTAQLEAANKELEAFSYSVSHDLRTPLRALNGFATILTEDYSMVLDEEGKRLLSVISENATKMGFLIDDLLSFSRLGRIEMLPSLINMKSMADTVYNELVPESEKHKIRFTLGNIPAAPGDPSMVKQVWVNLIGNAIKFTSKKTDRHIEIGVIAGENENIYFVKDNGAGFEMAKATKLFGVFQRLHTLKEFDGTGAGLAIVRRIILRHNGHVWAEGKVNEGATFYFTLP